jgi:hypothetical protein
MNARELFNSLMLALLFTGSAHAAPISHDHARTPDSPLEQVADPLAFPLPKLPNPWESAQLPQPSTVSAGAVVADAAPLPQANYPFENHANPPPGHNAKAQRTSLVQAAVTISEPASELLMLIALSALAIVIRRKMPE